MPAVRHWQGYDRGRREKLMQFMAYALDALYEYYVFRRKNFIFFRAIFKSLIETVKKRFIWKNITTHPFKCPPEVQLRAEEDLVQMVMGNPCPSNFLGVLGAGCRPHFPLMFWASTSRTPSSSQCNQSPLISWHLHAFSLPTRT